MPGAKQNCEVFPQALFVFGGLGLTRAKSAQV